MAEIINLRRAKKRVAREASEKQAADNRLRFGTARLERDLHAARRILSDRRLEDHRRENGGDVDK